MFEYFISGYYKTGLRTGHCNFSIVRTAPITQMEDIDDIANYWCQDNGADSLIILNYILMRAPE